MENPVYMDHNATTAVRPAVKDAVAEALELTGNASSVHASGRAARSLIEDARERVAALLGARPRDVVFTSGGTEANALALLGAAPGSDGIRRGTGKAPGAGVRGRACFGAESRTGYRNPSR